MFHICKAPLVAKFYKAHGMNKQPHPAEREYTRCMYKLCVITNSVSLLSQSVHDVYLTSDALELLEAVSPYFQQIANAYHASIAFIQFSAVSQHYHLLIISLMSCGQTERLDTSCLYAIGA